MEGQEQWAPLGWQGIGLVVPSTWCPGRLEGDFANGYLRVEDESDVRLELRWETAGRRAPPATKLVDKYVKQLRKKCRRSTPEAQVVRDMAVRRLAHLDHEAFTWQGEFSAHSLIAVCPETRRVVHVRVFFREGETRKSLARRIFGSLSTAPEDGQVEWSAFGFRFRVPSSWRLEESGLRTGCLRFVFKIDNDELEVVRFSLAEMLLREVPLAKWFADTFRKGLRKYRYETRSADYRGCPAVRCEGVMRMMARPMGFFRRKRRLAALAWHGQDIDKILVVRIVTATPNDPQLEAVAGSMTSD